MIASPARLTFQTTDVDAFRDTLVRLVSPFRIAARRGAYDARLEHDRLGDVAFTTIAYGNDVEVAVDCLERFYVLEVPLRGGLVAKCRGRERSFEGTAAHVIDPETPVRLRMDQRCQLLILRLDQPLLARQFQALEGGRRDGAPLLPEVVPLASQRGASFRRWLGFVHGELSDPASLFRTPRGARQAEQTLFALLLSLLEPEPAREERCAPYYVRRAEAFIEANLGGDIGLVDIVASSGVSMRALYDGFHRRRGVGPMAWLRQLRLERARAELAAADAASTSVTEVATRWGFVHLGRFAAAYRARFGESPSATLRR